LYGINTLGAAFGSFIAGYLLIGWLGFSGTLLSAVLMNTIVGCAALVLNRRSAVAQIGEIDQDRVEQREIWWGYRTILLASFLVGFIGLGMEMLWIRMLHVLTKNTAYSFPTILFVFLVGLALGGIFWGRKADKARDPVLLFCNLELIVGICAALSVLLFWFTIRLQIQLPWWEYYYLNPNILSANLISKSPFKAFLERIDGCDAACWEELWMIRAE
jgi:spermidine synthase